MKRKIFRFISSLFMKKVSTKKINEEPPNLYQQWEEKALKSNKESIKFFLSLSMAERQELLSLIKSKEESCINKAKCAYDICDKSQMEGRADWLYRNYNDLDSYLKN